MYKTSHMSLYSFTENEVLLKKEEVLSKLERLNYLEGLIKAKSTNTALRSAIKRPSNAGVDECEDFDYWF